MTALKEYSEGVTKFFIWGLYCYLAVVLFSSYGLHILAGFIIWLVLEVTLRFWGEWTLIDFIPETVCGFFDPRRRV